MKTLADVLELIHSSARRFRSARVVGRTDGTAWRLWWAGDAYSRFERDREEGVQVTVRAGPWWWTVGPSGEGHTNDGDPHLRLGMEPEFALLHTRSLLASAILEILREERVAGRPAVILRAAPRPGGHHSRWWGFWDSLEPMEVPIDLERGVALGGPGFRVEEIAFDEEFPPEAFSRPYPEDLPEVHRGFERPREMALEEARRAAGFPVLLPARLPEGARLLRCLVDPADPPGWVGLSWAIDPGHRFALHLRQGPSVAREASRLRGREIVREGARILLEEVGSEPVPSRRLFVERRGAWVEVDSDLPLDTILVIALSVGEGS